jgi:hypothetical protein
MIPSRKSSGGLSKIRKKNLNQNSRRPSRDSKKILPKRKSEDLPSEPTCLMNVIWFFIYLYTSLGTYEVEKEIKIKSKLEVRKAIDVASILWTLHTALQVQGRT